MIVGMMINSLRPRLISKLALMLALTISAISICAAAEPAAPQPGAAKIVSVGGDITEIIYALKADDKIVAVDTTSTFPLTALKTKKSVGYMRALSTEGVLSTGATTIIASDRAGPPEVVAALKSSAVAFHEIQETNSPDGVGDKIRKVGSLIGHTAEADALAANVAAKFKALETVRSDLGKKKRVLLILAIQNGRATVGGRGTSADAIIALAGGENAASDIDGFKPVTDEQLVQMAPDAVLAMKRSSGPSTIEDAKRLQGLTGSPAAAGNGMIEIDGSFVLGFGPRAPDAAKDLMLALYPDHKAAIEKAGP